MAASNLATGIRLVLLVVAASVLTFVVRRLLERIRRRHRRQATELAVIEFCDALAAELAAGVATGRAVELAAAVNPEWRAVVVTGRLGGDVAAALRDQAGRPGAHGLNAVAAAWEVSVGSGAALADVLDKTAAALRDEQEARVEVAAALAVPRATARMLAVLPLFGLGLGMSMGADPLGFLLGSTFGLAVLMCGLLLALIGVVWVERLADGAEQ